MAVYSRRVLRGHSHGVIRKRLLPIALFSFLSIHAVGQPANQRAVVPLAIEIKFDDSGPVAENTRVDLLNSTGIVVASAVTDTAGQVLFPGVLPGEYQLRVRGSGIDESRAPDHFAVQPWSTSTPKTIYVQRAKGPVTSLEGHVSAADLVVPEKAKSELAKAQSALQKNRLAEAEDHSARALDLFPSYANAYNVLGVIQMKKGDKVQGRSNFEKALQFDPKHASANLNLGKILLNEKKFAEAEQAIYTSTVSDPLNAESWTVLALAQLTQDKIDSAIASARRAHSLPHEGFAGCHLIALGAFEKRGDYANAAAELRIYISEVPGTPAPKLTAHLKELESRSR
jgi:Tfp pilus assembly protein PilF